MTHDELTARGFEQNMYSYTLRLGHIDIVYLCIPEAFMLRHHFSIIVVQNCTNPGELDNLIRLFTSK